MANITLLTSLIENSLHAELESQLHSFPDLATHKTEKGISLIQYAAYYRNQKAVEILRKYTTDLTIHEACSIGEIGMVKSLLSQRNSMINEYSPDGFTPLGLASFFGHFYIVELLLAHNAEPNIASNNSFKVTPLHSACAISNLEIAKLLIQHGADVNARQQQGVTPLHSAAHNGQMEIVKLLLQNGADTAAQMENGETPADMAKQKEYNDIAELIDLQFKK